MKKESIAFVVVIALVILTGLGSARAESTSINGNAFVVDPYTKWLGSSKSIGYLVDGQAFAYEKGSAFTFAPVQLPDGALVTGIKCVVKDNSETGYIQANLIRGPINIVDPAYTSQIVAYASTPTVGPSPNFQEIFGTANANYAAVDNTSYGYFFRVDFLSNPGINDKNLTLRGCVVSY